MRPDPVLSRRAFLGRIGVLGAAVAAGGLLPRAAWAQPANPVLPAPVDALRPVLATLARDTIAGLAVFACPGPDPYSAAQGTPRADPGAIEARTPDFLIEALDNFVPFPDEVARPIAAALATGLAESGVPLPGLEMLPLEAGRLDQAFAAMLQNDETLPLSFAVAGMLNMVATQVRPLAIAGPFPSPFANLTYAEKSGVFELIEGADADLVAGFDVHFPEPLKDSVSGLMRFVGGALLEFAQFGSYTEFAVFDSQTKQLTGRPVGWQLSGYLPDGPVEGHDDFIGYYQGRTAVSD